MRLALVIALALGGADVVYTVGGIGLRMPDGPLLGVPSVDPFASCGPPIDAGLIGYAFPIEDQAGTDGGTQWVHLLYGGPRPTPSTDGGYAGVVADGPGTGLYPCVGQDGGTVQCGGSQYSLHTYIPSSGTGSSNGLYSELNNQGENIGGLKLSYWVMALPDVRDHAGGPELSDGGSALTVYTIIYANGTNGVCYPFQTDYGKWVYVENLNLSPALGTGLGDLGFGNNWYTSGCIGGGSNWPGGTYAFADIHWRTANSDGGFATRLPCTN